VVELQSLRGIAAVAVMLGHSLTYYAVPAWFVSLALLCNGRAAVVVFFVLSGYVLTRSLRNSRFDRASILRFYLQRAFRIYPAIWAASALGLWYLFALHWRIPVDDAGPRVQGQFRADRMDLLHIAASLAGMLAFILPQLWSIFVEIVGSVAMPLLAFGALRRTRWMLVMLAGSIAASYLIGQYTYYYVGLYFMDFVVGAALAMPRSELVRLCSGAPAPALVGILLIALSLTQYLPTEYYDPTAHLVETALSASVIALLVHARRRVKSLSFKPLVFIGDISYSIYLLHYAVLCILAKLFALAETAAGVRPDLVPLSVLLTALTCLFTMPLAWLSYRFVEMPGVALGKFLLSTWPLSRVLAAPEAVRRP
jgi:peptidoglycan/LPS O-acetylase OafA/YrhL